MGIGRGSISEYYFITILDFYIKPKIFQKNMNNNPMNLEDALSSPERNLWIKAIEEDFIF